LIRQGSVKPSDAWGLTFWSRNACRDKIRHLRSDGMFTPQTLRGSIEMPSYAGGSNWGAGAWNPATQTLFANVNDLPMEVQLLPRAEYNRQIKAGGAPGWEYAPQDGTPYGMRRRALTGPSGGGAGPGARAHCLEPAAGQQPRAGALAVLVSQGRAQHGRSAGHAQRVAVHRRQYRWLPARL
jgi:hypothetical protein